MGGYVCIETFCTTENFDHIQNPDFREGQQRAIDRVKGAYSARSRTGFRLIANSVPIHPEQHSD